MAVRQFRHPGAPLTGAQQAAMYFARKRRRARLDAQTPSLISVAAAIDIGFAFDEAALVAEAQIAKSYLGFSLDSTGQQNISVPGFSLGAAAADRWILLGTGRRFGGAVSSVTIGGVAMTNIAGSPSGNEAQLWLLKVPTGTSATVNVSFSSAPQASWFAAWRLQNLFDVGGGPLGTVVDADVVAAPGSLPLTLTMDTVSGGAAFGIMSRSAQASCVWGNLQEDFDQNSGAGITGSGASAITGGSPLTITADPGNQSATLIGVTLKPQAA